MGSAASKASRSYPKSAKPAWSGARTESLPKASQVKSKDIEKDAQDPHFLSNLSKLGAVRVDHHHVQPVRPSAPSNNVVRSRIRLEHAGRDDISAQTLSALLTHCKSAQTPRELESLVQKYGIDLNTFRKVATFINTPSINSATVIRTVNKDGQESQTMPAVWVEHNILKY
ncbi:hypothetical protein BDZ89DRAFT_587940 [Hymenopellis radicata]|nr:hypothetical protein BDZ89DRAFT_587940 [Hymenopellis radicata]